MGNPERDWGLPSWSTGKVNKPPNFKITYHGGAKPPKKGSGGSGGGGKTVGMAIALVAVPALTMLGLAGYLLHGYGVI